MHFQHARSFINGLVISLILFSACSAFAQDKQPQSELVGATEQIAKLNERLAAADPISSDVKDNISSTLKAAEQSASSIASLEAEVRQLEDDINTVKQRDSTGYYSALTSFLLKRLRQKATPGGSSEPFLSGVTLGAGLN